jgi:hypothetical protein
MRKTKVNIKMLDTSYNSVEMSPWIVLANDAERRSKDLAKAAKIFREKERQREPWPGAQSERHKPKSCHSV